jgi:uridine kinase
MLPHREPLLPASTWQGLLAVVREHLQREHALVVAIDGAAGLGKTSLAREVQQEFLDLTSILHTDDYLTERHERLAQGITAYDPRAIAMDTLVRDIEALAIDGRDIIIRPYQHPTGTHGTPTVIPARPLVIIEGGHALNPAVLDAISPVGVFIEGTPRTMYELRRERDLRERGASAATFATWWPKMHADFERFVRSNRENAALLVQRRTGKTSLVLRDHLRAVQRGTSAGLVEPAHLRMPLSAIEPG